VSGTAPDTARHAQRHTKITLGIIAGGRASRLGGIDKAWMQRDGQPQVLRLASRFGPKVDALLVSANRDLPRYAQADMCAVSDRHADIGPLGGLDALANACNTPWLLTLPVDIVDANDCLLDTLLAAGGQGAWVEDDAGLQPLVALWNRDALRAALKESIETRDYAVQGLQRRIGMQRVRLQGVRLGNLNTFEDLDAAGVQAQ
jgi:molybdopterin-guanine dinucleotide biosynthesis protein A